MATFCVSASTLSSASAAILQVARIEYKSVVTQFLSPSTTVSGKVMTAFTLVLIRSMIALNISWRL